MTDSPTFPHIISQHSEGNEWVLEFSTPEELLYFEGHFDEAAILPGVVQLHWAQHYGVQQFAIDREVSHLEAVKFQNVIRPSHAVILRLRYDSDKRKLYFSYDSEHGRHSSGRIVYR